MNLSHYFKRYRLLLFGISNLGLSGHVHSHIVHKAQDQIYIKNHLKSKLLSLVG